MHLREGEFEKAHTDFFEAFKNYDESGSPRRTTCLKYLVLANMLMKSGINPFDSQEVRNHCYWFECLLIITISKNEARDNNAQTGWFVHVEFLIKHSSNI